MDDYTEEALATGYMWPSTSPVAPGFFFVNKKDGCLRPCIAYQDLNAVTICYPFPLPMVPAALEQVCKARLLTKLDFIIAFNPICIKEGDERKMGFHTTWGHYNYIVMPSGLTNAPAVFQSFINKIFKDMLNHYVITYIN